MPGDALRDAPACPPGRSPQTPGRGGFGWLACGLLLAHTAVAGDLPLCLNRAADQAPQAAVLAVRPSNQDLLARLVYAETRSTGFADDPRVARGIAWGAMNRVRLGEVSASARRRYGSGVAGVIFQPQQFNPAVSRRSPFAGDFLCPKDAAAWQLAVDAAGAALRGHDNPLIETPWERRHGLSLVVNFYYPRSPQARGPLAPWEGSAGLSFIGKPESVDLPPAARVRFYRLDRPPADLDPALRRSSPPASGREVTNSP
ncbi:cell wall hydrolase [Accumulibacter sp.]|uniref:cell wall hydrolase n=1 Tax=Accumulibacter sp. TaxID=2053492 RepID=UPI0025D2B2D0|nr:cell wall hydrolase [Accumulibacter sp.]MCM8595756.1 cell wall hydrolase [Accumulibacter sp.]MDS4049904.1 cell wall hydrolase [Accumulibacter sp.]